MTPAAPPMRVLVIVEAFPRLSETFVVQLVLEAQRRGCDITILSLQPGDDAAVSEALRQSGVLERIVCLGVPGGPINRVLGLPAAIGRLLQGRRNPLHPIRLSEYGRSVLTLRGVHSVARLAQSQPLGEFDVVHAHFGPNGVLALQLQDAGFFSGPIVVSFHGRDATAYPRRFGENVYAPLFRRAASLTAPSNFIADRLAALGAPTELISQLPSPFDPESFMFRQRQRAEQETLRLLTVGRLVPKKGIADALVAVASLVHDHGVDLTYEVVGDGPLLASLQSRAKALEIRNRVRFTGAMRPDDLTQAYDRSDIFILTSVTAPDGDHEGFGVVLLEAQASGLPVIATRHNGFPDAVREGESAVLIDEHSPDQLAEAVLQLSSDPDRMTRMGVRGHEYVQKFGRASVGATLLGLYQTVSSAVGGRGE